MKALVFLRGPFFILSAGFVIGLHGLGMAQDQGRSLSSAIDDLVSIQRISVLPVSDNLEGIYSRPIESDLIEKVKAGHRWNYVEANVAGPLMTAPELEQDESKVRELGIGIGADGIIAAKITKGPNGVSIRLDLFLVRDGKLFIQVEANDLKQFDIASLKEQTSVLWSRLISQLPYQGMILSRQGQRVTVNLGKRDGITEDSVINAIQILQMKRHPKFNFMIGTEKEIIGKIKLLKIDDTLSFGQVVLEKDKNALGKGTKLAGLDSVSYPITGLSSPDSGEAAKGARLEGQTSFGENPNSWVPKRPPTFGQVGARFGFGQFYENMSLNTVGPISATNSLYPLVALEGELWITPEWTVRARLNQGIIPIDNPRSNSTPTSLSQSLTETDLSLAYVFISGYSVWDTRVEGSFGYSNYRLYVDDSDLRGFTTSDFGGFKFGAKGSFPVTDDLDWSVGGYINYFLNPSLKESPVSSGDDNDASINQFGIIGSRRLGEYLKIEASLDFAAYSAKFFGAGGRGDEAAKSMSHRHTGLSAAVHFLF